MSMRDKIVAVVVTHRRAELLAASLSVLATQTRPVDHIVVVDNADEERSPNSLLLSRFRQRI